MISLLLPTPRQIGVYAAHGNPVAWDMLSGLRYWDMKVQSQRSRSWYGTWPTSEAERVKMVPPWGASEASEAYVLALVELQFESERMADQVDDPMGFGLPVDGVCPHCDNDGVIYSDVDTDENFCDWCQEGAKMKVQNHNQNTWHGHVMAQPERYEGIDQ